MNIFAKTCAVGALAAGLLGCSHEVIENTESSGAAIVTLPVHGIDTYWHGAHGETTTRVDQRVRIDQSQPKMYWALHAFNASTGMYMGLQSSAELNDGTQGKRAIFSVWDADAATAGGPGSWCQDFGGEGVGKSCRIAYEFIVGREYVYSLRYLFDDGVGLWWQAFITDTVTGEQTGIGNIRAPKSYGLIRYTGNFSEVYAGTFSSCEAVPFAQAVWWPQETWGLDQPGSVPASINYSRLDTCTDGRALPYGGVLVHQMGR